MHISELGRQRVQPRRFWTAIGIVTLLLGAMGIFFIQTGRVPSIPPWLWAGFLLFVWGSVLLSFLRYGRKAFPWWRVVGLVGYTLFAGSQLMPHLRWMEGLSLLLMMCGLLWPWIKFGKRPSSAPLADTPTHFAP